MRWCSDLRQEVIDKSAPQRNFGVVWMDLYSMKISSHRQFYMTPHWPGIQEYHKINVCATVRIESPIYKLVTNCCLKIYLTSSLAECSASASSKALKLSTLPAAAAWCRGLLAACWKTNKSNICLIPIGPVLYQHRSRSRIRLINPESSCQCQCVVLQFRVITRAFPGGWAAHTEDQTEDENQEKLREK